MEEQGNERGEEEGMRNCVEYICSKPVSVQAIPDMDTSNCADVNYLLSRAIASIPIYVMTLGDPSLLHLCTGCEWLRRHGGRFLVV